MLWILMILSPIAFLSYIFPASKNIKKFFPSILHWEGWWEEFLQWVLVGIPLGFFLYLSNWIMRNQSVIDDAKVFDRSSLDTYLSGVSALDVKFIDLVTSILAPTVALVLLYKGYKIAKETAPAAARGIIAGVKKIGTLAAAAGITAVTMGAGAGLAAKALGGVSAGARRLEAFTGRAGFSVRGRRIEPFKYLVGKPISGVTRGMEMVARPTLEKYAAKVRKEDVGEAMKGTEDDITAQVDRAKGALTGRGKIQRFAWMVKEGTFQKAPQVWESAAKLTRKFSKDPHFQKEAGDIADVIPDLIDAETKKRLEPTKKLRNEMKEKIEKTAKKLSIEVEMKPVINDEAAKIAKEKFKKDLEELSKEERKEAQDLAAKNVAARYIHFTELKSGDMKKVAKKSIESVIASRALRGTTPQHLQAIVNNFKPETINKVLKQVSSEMFIGRDDKENKKILEDYYKSDPKHARMIRWSLKTPAPPPAPPAPLIPPGRTKKTPKPPRGRTGPRGKPAKTT